MHLWGETRITHNTLLAWNFLTKMTLTTQRWIWDWLCAIEKLVIRRRGQLAISGRVPRVQARYKRAKKGQLPCQGPSLHSVRIIKSNISAQQRWLGCKELIHAHVANKNQICKPTWRCVHYQPGILLTQEMGHCVNRNALCLEKCIQENELKIIRLQASVGLYKKS